MPKAEKKVKTETVELFERTAKDAKRFEEKENTSRAALVYRAVLKHGPVSLDDLFAKTEKEFAENFRGQKKNIKGNIRTFLRNFRKEGLVKTSEAPVAKSAAA